VDLDLTMRLIPNYKERYLSSEVNEEGKSRNRVREKVAAKETSML
jgi:hypothetical protein